MEDFDFDDEDKIYITNFKYPNEIEDRQDIYISNDIHFVISDYDIRYFKDRKMILEINTYPFNPRELLKLIRSIKF